MAKYTINYSCGHGSCEKNLTGKNKYRKNKIEWLESTLLCPECWKAFKDAENKKRGLEFIIGINPYNIDKPLIVWYDGDTIPYKDEIKALGYRWGYRDPLGVFGALETTAFKCWSKNISKDDLQNETEKAKGLGAKVINKVSEVDLQVYKTQSEKEQKTKQEKQKKINQLVKPKRPNCLPEGRWNGTIYGGKSSQSVYVDGEKIILTQEEVTKIENYKKKNEEYIKEIQKIEGEVES